MFRFSLIYMQYEAHVIVWQIHGAIKMIYYYLLLPRIEYTIAASLWTNTGLMLVQRRRIWATITLAFITRLVFAEISALSDYIIFFFSAH